MTIGALALTAITAVLLLLGAWIGICIDTNRLAANRERENLRLSEQFVEELTLVGSRYGLAVPKDKKLRNGCASPSAHANRSAQPLK